MTVEIPVRESIPHRDFYVVRMDFRIVINI